MIRRRRRTVTRPHASDPLRLMPSQAARYLGIAYRDLARLTREGIIPAARELPPRYRLADLRAYRDRMDAERLNVPMDSKLAAKKMKCPKCGAQRLISPSGLLCENFDCGGVEPLTHRERVELRSRYHHEILGK